MKDLEKNLTDLKRSNPMSLFYEFGMTPDEIKSSIIDSFSSYFKNPDNLNEFAVSDLVGTWLSYLTIYRDHPDSLKLIKMILDIFNDAKLVNETQTIEAYLEWYPELNQSISRFWSLYNSQNNIIDLPIEDYLEVVLRTIGQSIEGLAKAFLKLLLHLNRIRRNKSFNVEEIRSKDLGVIVDELINTTNLTDLLILRPNNIRLNQWRNIAYHHNSKVINGKIFCSIKRNNLTEEFEISRTEIFNVLKTVLAVFKLIRVSETIFLIDNIQQIESKSVTIKESQLNVREESKLLDFYSSLSSQGFKVTDIKYDAEVAKMELYDMEDYGDLHKRAIHSSQFLYNLWLFTNSKQLTINYHLFTGAKFFTSEIDSSNFIKHSNSNVDFLKLMEGVKFSFISVEFPQNKDPFQDLKLSDEIKNHPQIFYSQLGQKITIEEFSKQFILSVFCNYLALKSEGFQDIKISIGNDGSVAWTEKPKSILLTVPAPIENKAFQIILIELLDTTISLYDQMELKRDIVLEAKNTNKYYQKKSLIKDQAG